jgi:restriction endonuclease S subunit
VKISIQQVQFQELIETIYTKLKFPLFLKSKPNEKSLPSSPPTTTCSKTTRRRIAILETMAEEIYREWFVRFRFPGYQRAKFEKGIPEGWESKTSDEVLYILSGGTPKTDKSGYWDGEIPFFTPKDASKNFYVLTTEKYITENG